MKFIILLLVIVASKDKIDRNKMMEKYIGLTEKEATDLVNSENLSEIYTINYLHVGDIVQRQKAKQKPSLRFTINEEGLVTDILFD